MATAKRAAKAATPARKAAPARKTAPAAPARPRAAGNARASPAAPMSPKGEKPKKPKLVRDSFTIPKSEYVVLEQLKQRAAQAGKPAKKSEVLRAGVKALAGMGDTAFLAALAAVPTIKTGRPAKT